jgi:hypothetical protein
MLPLINKKEKSTKNETKMGCCQFLYSPEGKMKGKMFLLIKQCFFG